MPLQETMRIHAIPERDTVVPSFYDETIHPNPNAVVTSGGKPIVRSGEVLRVGLVPIERRFAVGPDRDGACEVMPQHEFERDHERWYRQEYAAKGQASEGHFLEHIPRVEEFVAWKVEPVEQKRLVPLGTVPEEEQVQRTAQVLYSPAGDRVITREEWEKSVRAEERDRMSRENADLRAENTRLKQHISSFEERLSALEAPSTEAPSSPAPQGEPQATGGDSRASRKQGGSKLREAPCGRSGLSGERGLHRHMTTCPKCREIEEGRE